ncbi:hypothetical protein [Rhizomonospora bruguierae]|uniref:hypothetical protein n=1 Tax=Rhizomonospora bruguierae TaxID=1581705 RepID=UPI001BCD56F9|nr:hypothetical protein [Micromonospora sp. NBRC 107566]
MDEQRESMPGERYGTPGPDTRNGHLPAGQGRAEKGRPAGQRQVEEGYPARQEHVGEDYHAPEPRHGVPDGGWSSGSEPTGAVPAVVPSAAGETGSIPRFRTEPIDRAALRRDGPRGDATAVPQRAETQRAETQRAETQRAETQRAETQRAETQRAETQRAETQRAETQGTEPTYAAPPHTAPPRMEPPAGEAFYRARRPAFAVLLGLGVLVLEVPALRILITAALREPVSGPGVVVVVGTFLVLGLPLFGAGLYGLAGGAGKVPQRAGEAWLRPPVAYLLVALVLFVAAGLAVG